MRPNLNQVAVLILESDARNRPDDPELVVPADDSPSRMAIAAVLGVDTDDLAAVVADVEANLKEGAWAELVLMERTQLALDSRIARAASWDRIEAIAARKLATLVEAGAINKAADLLRVAEVANRASRNQPSDSSGGAATNQNTNNIFIGVQAGQAGEVLPSGDLGEIRLSLSSRVKEQLSQKRSAAGKVLETSKMLDVHEIRALDAESESEDATAEPAEDVVDV